jgi:hypothetical protein
MMTQGSDDQAQLWAVLFHLAVEYQDSLEHQPISANTLQRAVRPRYLAF